MTQETPSELSLDIYKLIENKNINEVTEAILFCLALITTTLEKEASFEAAETYLRSLNKTISHIIDNLN